MRTKTHKIVTCILTAALASSVALPARSQGSSEAAPPAPQVVEAVESLIAEINVVRTAFGFSHDHADAEPQSNREPVHVYAKTLEVLHKMRQLQAQLGLSPTPARRLSFQPVSASDAIANLEHLVQQMRDIREELAIDGTPEPAQVAADATLSTAYGRLAVASLMLDGLRGGPLMPGELFQAASVAFHDLEAIAKRLEIALDVKQEAPLSAKPAEIAQDVMHSIEKAIDIQAKLGMAPSSAPDFTPVRVTSSEIYDLTGILAAELSRIGHRIGIEEGPLPVAEFRNKTLLDLYARIRQIREGLERFTEDRIELALARMDGEAKEPEGQQQDEAAQVADAPATESVTETTQAPRATGEATQSADAAAEPIAETPQQPSEAAQVADATAQPPQLSGAGQVTDAPADDPAIEALQPPEATGEATQSTEAAQIADAAAEPVTKPPQPSGATQATDAPAVDGDIQADVMSPTKPPCAVALSSGSGGGPDYPRRGRRDLGNATIQVQFHIDENGKIIQNRTEALLDQSTATREASIDLFARAAINAVNRWRLEFEEPEDQSCERTQSLSARFSFKFDE